MEIMNSVPVSDKNLSEQAFRKLMRASRLVRQVMEPFFEGYGLSISQWVTLNNIYDWEKRSGEAVRLIDLSNQMIIKQPTLTVVINKLASLGMIERLKPAGDRRERRIKITEKGRRLISETLELRKFKIENLLKNWNAEDKLKVLDLLDKLMGGLESSVRAGAINRGGK